MIWQGPRKWFHSRNHQTKHQLIQKGIAQSPPQTIRGVLRENGDTNQVNFKVGANYKC
jgi:hypothetical protein